MQQRSGPDRNYVLSPAPPVRAMAISAVGDLVGAVLLVLGLDRGLIIVMVIGVVVLSLSIGTLLAAYLLRARLRVTVDLDDAGVTVSTAGRRATATWSEIDGISTDGRTLYLDRDEDAGPALKIDSPRGGSDQRFAELAAELTDRMDSDRGFRRLG